MVGFDVPQVAHDMMLRFMGVDFGRIHEGTASRIESSVGGTEKPSVTPGGNAASDIEQKAKWEGKGSHRRPQPIIYPSIFLQPTTMPVL